MLKIVGARVLGLRPEVILAVIAVEGAYREAEADCVIRFGIDGVHSRGSEHYTGLAIDFRTHNVAADKRAGLVQKVTEALGPDYDVIWEAQGTPNEHLHVEYDPKEPY
jgi:hypothetical protein